MWIMMNKAYFSIVENKKKKNELLVKARVNGDIERIFPKAKVLTGVGTDYLYRASIPRDIVSDAIKNQIASINYSNFKNSVPWTDTLRHKVYFNVWHALHKLQNSGWRS